MGWRAITMDGFSRKCGIAPQPCGRHLHNGKAARARRRSTQRQQDGLLRRVERLSLCRASVGSVAVCTGHNTTWDSRISLVRRHAHERKKILVWKHENFDAADNDWTIPAHWRDPEWSPHWPRWAMNIVIEEWVRAALANY